MEPITDGLAAGRHRALRVVIIGAGFSGTLVAIHLLRQSDSVQIDLVDQRLPGRGLAYGTIYDEHLLNVPAIRMSAFGSEPRHFLDWLRAHGMPSADPGLFAPRKLYGAYIQDVLQSAARSVGPYGRLRHHFTEAVRVSFDGLSANVILRSEERLDADKVVLALGNSAPREVLDPLPGYFGSPWAPGALSGLDAEKDVLLVGAGLTAVDAFLALISQEHRGRIHMLSRRGKLPQVHAPYRPLPNAFQAPRQVTARGLLNAIRAEIRAGQIRGVDWRAVIDSIRPVTNDIWQRLDQREQLRFFRHLKTWWDIHRHRMASEIGVKVRAAIERRQLIVHAGRLQKLAPGGAGLEVDIQLRIGARTSVKVERVINCTGPNDDYRKTANALIQNLIGAGYAVPGSIGKGFETTAQGELVNANGRPADWLLTLGPPRVGDLLETVAVPELRKQAEAIANRLLSITGEPLEVMPEIFMAAGI